MLKKNLKETQFSVILDTSGLLCPLPVLKLQKKIKELEKGQKIKLISDDPASRIDVPHFCKQSNNKLLNVKFEKIKTSDKIKFEFQIKKN